MPVEIKIFGESGYQTLDELGVLARGLLSGTGRQVPAETADLAVADAMARQRGENIDGSPRRETTEAPEGSETAPTERRARRTKAQIEADNAAAEAAKRQAGPTDAGRAISSSPEDRVNPDDKPAVDGVPATLESVRRLALIYRQRNGNSEAAQTAVIDLIKAEALKVDPAFDFVQISKIDVKMVPSILPPLLAMVQPVAGKEADFLAGKLEPKDFIAG